VAKDPGKTICRVAVNFIHGLKHPNLSEVGEQECADEIDVS
jgi:hypothetical protein